MSRFAIILCLIPRVISGIYTTVRHQTYSEHISRQSRSNLPTQSDYVYRQFDKPGEQSTVEQPTVDPYVVNDYFGSIGSFGQGASDSQAPYTEVISPYTTPSSLMRSNIDYALAKSASEAGYESSKFRSDSVLDKLKSLMHYHPPPELANSMAGYDGNNDYHVDDEDIRSSRSLYDNWPYFYHSPYEYEHNKDLLDVQKAKDKRYVADRHEAIIPVNEIIEHDYPQSYERTAKYTRDVTDNPIRGNGPFFSFVLNDYFDRNGDDDPVIFRGLDIGNDFDHDTYLPVTEENILSRRIGNSYYTTGVPVTVPRDQDSMKLSESESSRDRTAKREDAYDKRENGAKKNSEHKTEYENHTNQYNGFKDFLDNFANKFGSENMMKNFNIIQAVNQDQGENKKGFRRVYHKDEYQEDNEFYDNKNSSLKGLEKGGYNANIGGSEAYLRSQAAAAVGNETKAASNSGNTNDAKFENSHQGYDRVNTLENRLDRYRNVAKEAALKNNADYIDTYKDLYGK